MVEIRKINDKKTAEKICLEHGVEWSEDHHVIATLEGDSVLQCAVFDYKGETGHIHTVAGFDDDIFMLDGLCRAILNIMDINGVTEVYMPLKHKKIAEYVGFSLHESGEYFLNLVGFFNCGCCKK